MAARKDRFEFRLRDDERKEIEANAEAAGFDSVGDYVRTMALTRTSIEGEKPEPAAGECTHTEIEDLSNGTTIVNAGRCKGCGEIVKIDPDRGSVYSEGAGTERERVAVEVAEAKLKDDAARETFLERRTRELHGAGRTTPVARREAEAEWRAR